MTVKLLLLDEDEQLLMVQGRDPLTRISNRRDNGQMFQLVQPLADAVGPSIVQILSSGRPVALGMVRAGGFSIQNNLTHSLSLQIQSR